MIYYSVYKGPLGDIMMASTDRGISRITLQAEDAGEFFGFLQSQGEYTESAEKNAAYINQLDEYFRGNLKVFNVSLDIRGTVFQLKVWDELIKIPYGQVRTYGEIAKTLGMSCSRAIGQANKRNPVPIIVPCHRVVSSSGIGGYAGEVNGNSIDIKRYLLNLENFDCSVFDKK